MLYLWKEAWNQREISCSSVQLVLRGLTWHACVIISSKHRPKANLTEPWEWGHLLPPLLYCQSLELLSEWLWSREAASEVIGHYLHGRHWLFSLSEWEGGCVGEGGWGERERILYGIVINSLNKVRWPHHVLTWTIHAFWVVSGPTSYYYSTPTLLQSPKHVWIPQRQLGWPHIFVVNSKASRLPSTLQSSRGCLRDCAHAPQAKFKKWKLEEGRWSGTTSLRLFQVTDTYKTAPSLPASWQKNGWIQ